MLIKIIDSFLSIFGLNRYVTITITNTNKNRIPDVILFGNGNIYSGIKIKQKWRYNRLLKQLKTKPFYYSSFLLSSSNPEQMNEAISIQKQTQWADEAISIIPRYYCSPTQSSDKKSNIFMNSVYQFNKYTSIKLAMLGGTTIKIKFQKIFLEKI